jgi:hypothetical protein
MISVAALGRQTPRSATTKRRMAAKQIRHAVAISNWEPESLPESLTKEYFKTIVQPRLRRICVRALAEKLGVSKPYAHLIRSGRETPHPRHWQALAEIAKC